MRSAAVGNAGGR